MAKGECPGCNTPNEYSEICCTMCGQRLPWAAASAPPRPAVAVSAPTPAVAPPKRPVITNDLSGVPRIGGVFFLGGIACAVYFLFFFDTSVAVPAVDFMGTQIGGGRVNNLGLMSTRTNGIIAGFGCAILGAMVMAWGMKQMEE